MRRFVAGAVCDSATAPLLVFSRARCSAAGTELTAAGWPAVARGRSRPAAAGSSRWAAVGHRALRLPSSETVPEPSRDR